MSTDQANTYAYLAVVLAGWAVCYFAFVFYVVRKIRSLPDE